MSEVRYCRTCFVRPASPTIEYCNECFEAMLTNHSGQQQVARPGWTVMCPGNELPVPIMHWEQAVRPKQVELLPEDELPSYATQQQPAVQPEQTEKPSEDESPESLVQQQQVAQPEQMNACCENETRARKARRECTRCGLRPPVPMELYCRECRKQVLKEQKESGYLDSKPIGHVGQRRPSEAREDIRETKYGKDR